MSKKKKIILATSVALTVLLAIIVLFVVGVFQVPSIRLEASAEVLVENGVAQPEQIEKKLVIDKAGQYSLDAEWEAGTPGLITGCTITDEKGEIVIRFTAESMYMTSGYMELETGEYTLTLDFITSQEKWNQFCEVEDGDVNAEENYQFAQNGQWDMEYRFNLEREESAMHTGVVLGMIFGLILVALIVTLAKKGDDVQYKFDERQELARGRGFKYAFFTMLISNLFIFGLKMAEVLTFAGTEVVLVFTSVLGISVYACYCIWNDAYFALNENRKVIIIVMVVGGILNLILGIWAILDGSAWKDGQLTFRCLNLICGIMLLVVGAAIILKKVLKDGKDE